MRWSLLYIVQKTINHAFEKDGLHYNDYVALAEYFQLKHNLSDLTRSLYWDGIKKEEVLSFILVVLISNDKKKVLKYWKYTLIV